MRACVCPLSLGSPTPRLGPVQGVCACAPPPPTQAGHGAPLCIDPDLFSVYAYVRAYAPLPPRLGIRTFTDLFDECVCVCAPSAPPPRLGMVPLHIAPELLEERPADGSASEKNTVVFKLDITCRRQKESGKMVNEKGGGGRAEGFKACRVGFF